MQPRDEEVHNNLEIRLHQTEPKPRCPRTSSRNGQETESNALPISSLRSTLGIFCLWIALEVLGHLGFSPVWCNLISKLLCSSSTRVLVNGEPGKLICHQRGLRQGDPLSPMLFILFMDVLNSFFSRASDMGLLQPLFFFFFFRKRRRTAHHFN